MGYVLCEQFGRMLDAEMSWPAAFPTDPSLRHGVRNIVALRGDPPRGQEKWTATEGGFSSALDLVKCHSCTLRAGYTVLFKPRAL